jgi:PKD repeat protein
MRNKKFSVILAFSIAIISVFLLLRNINVESTEPPSSIKIDIPHYTVERVEGLDYVEIPGGDVVLEEGKPRVPYYFKKINYDRIYRVQDVILKSKNGLITAKDLKLPIVSMLPDSSLLNLEEQELVDEWFPKKDYDWQVIENTDDTLTLILNIYPFFYNAKTTEVNFYTKYEFDIKFITSSISILEVSLEKNYYEPGEKVAINVIANNSGEAQDIFLNTIVKRYPSLEVLDSLPLVSIKGLKGDGLITQEWDTKGFDAGNYLFEISLLDTSSNILDKEICHLSLGRALIEIKNFSVSPKKFKVGDEILISMTFQNKGSGNVSGTSIFKVIIEGNVKKELKNEFKDLRPKDSITISDKWKTSDEDKGMLYTIVGYIEYESQSTEIKREYVSTNSPPTANFTISPDKPKVGEDITFDASSSSDSDGNIVKYEWDFGKGEIEGEKIIIHRFNQEGDYSITLKVTDNESGIGSITKTITVLKEVTKVEKIEIKLYIGNKKYYVNGIEKEMDVAPIIYENRTLLPIRYVAEALGAEVKWEQAEQKVTIIFKDITIELWIGKNNARVNGTYKFIDPENPEVKPIVIPPGRTMLPIRFIAENMGCKVDWDANLKEVKITYPAT